MAVSDNKSVLASNQGGDNHSSSQKPFKKRQILSYVFLPGIIPELKRLFGSGFGYLAFLIALVYQGVRILPANHPCTRQENIGSYGIGQVIGEASNHIKLNKKNIDQVIIFFAILFGIAILGLQFLGFVLMLLTGNAFAADITPDSFGGIFSTPSPDTDIAFHMMREVFGIPGFFGELEGGQSSLHIALQTMFQFYNLAILVVAIVVFLYYVIVVVAETAQTGTPFGQRFSHIYAPIRLVIAIGLLVPLNYGFNGAQYLTFYAAKLGSGFATTGWTQFNVSLVESNPLGADTATLIAPTKRPDVDALVEFMAMAVTCREAHLLQGYMTGDTGTAVEGIVNVDHPKNLIPGQRSMPFTPATLNTLVDAGWDQPIEIIFGVPDTNSSSASSTSEIPEAAKYVETCGKAIIPVNLAMKDTGTDFFAGQLQKNYYLQIAYLWNVDPRLKKLGKHFACYHHKGDQVKKAQYCNQEANAAGEAAFNSAYSEAIGAGFSSAEAEGIASDASNSAYQAEKTISKALIETTFSHARIRFDEVIRQYYAAAQAGTDTAIKQETLDLGWGGAGIWYNRIAQINGGYVTAVRDIPRIKTYPDAMEKVLEARRKADSNVSGCKIFQRNTSNQKPVDLGSGKDNYYADTLNAAYQYWKCDDSKEKSDNFILDFISVIFGLDGLLSIRDRVETGEVNDQGEPLYTEIHPLAKLSALGKGLIESAVRSIALGLGSSFFGGLLGGTQFGTAFAGFSGFFTTIATIGLSVGFITYYILPFLPFMYFFFALGNWVKSIFEAMVGTPLWALAHLTMDGDGLPGKMAMNGYLLIFEIFLRPILTVFGLLGGMAVFTTLAHVTNDIFDIVVRVGVGVDISDNAENADKIISMHVVDVFFFTIVYAVILYMMAVSSFKMINLVPNNILRWLGNSVAAFSDNAPDPTQGLTQYAAIGGAKVGGDLTGGLASGAQGLGSAIQAPFRLASGGNN
jgi:conjugal transfer/type IV secretion protein DotA/TraY